MRNETPKEERLLQELVKKSPRVLEVESRLDRDGRIGINIGSLEGQFLKCLVAQGNVEKVVEIGTQYGCSTTYIAEAIGPKGHIYALEKDETCIREATESFSQLTGCEINLLRGEAKASLKSIESEGPFDLVFIDANKSGYLDYYLWAKEFLRPGGYLVADNVFLFGTMFENQCPEGTPPKMWKKMKTFLGTLFADSDFHSSLLPTKEGLSFSVKKEES